MKSRTVINEGGSVKKGVTVTDDAFMRLRKMATLSGESGYFEVSDTGSPSIRIDGCVGHMAFSDGSMLDVLPTIEGRDVPEDSLMRMLYSIFNLEYRPQNEPIDLFEFFVMVFIREVRLLLKKGIKFTYTMVQRNEKVFKGRMLFSENIRENYVHKERVYVEFEEFSPDRAENRLIKRTLEALSKVSTSGRNRKDISSILLSMDELESSMNVGRDFSMVNIDRNMTDYVSPMVWCDIFLNGMGFGGSSGAKSSYAMLVDTGQLIDAYVAKVSSHGRTDGSYSIDYKASTVTDGSVGGDVVVTVGLRWSFFNTKIQEYEEDAEMMFMKAPGYRVIPRTGRDRIRAMAANYLMEASA